MFNQFDEKSAPEKSRLYLNKTLQSFGMIPNLERTMAALPELLSVYAFAWEEFTHTPLTPIEQQVVYQVINFENECNYCVPWHTLLSRQVGMSEDVILALREGTVIPDYRLQVLAVFTRRILQHRGKVSKLHLEEFFAAGFEEVHVLAVVLGVAIKTLSNFTNSIADTPLDKQVQNLQWQKPFQNRQV